VRSHLNRAYRRMGVADRTQAVLLANEQGWL
jgi:DNA-binding NarL/FixJ family response regulator